jgi:hypothetical protein
MGSKLDLEGTALGKLASADGPLISLVGPNKRWSEPQLMVEAAGLIARATSEILLP